MLAESLLTLEPAGPEEPQAARLTASPAAVIATAAERNFRNVMSFPFILRAQRWVPVTYEAGIASAPRRITHIDSVDGRTDNSSKYFENLRPVVKMYR